MIRHRHLNSTTPIALLAIALVTALALCAAPRSAFADEEGGDILLGMFTSATEGGTNNVFASYDGATFYRIASVYESKEHEPYYGYHHAQACTSIIYHDGFFWALSGQNRNDGKFWPSISYSKDLVHWTHPEGGSLLTGAHGIPVDELPYVSSDKKIAAGEFDVVAPEWSITSSGEIYIVFSAGYFGARYGEPGTDQMQAYTVHVTTLSAQEGIPDGDSGYLWPNKLVFQTDETAKKLEFTNYDRANYIDGQLFSDNGTDYLIIKIDGAKNQLLKTTDIDDPGAWTMVNDNVSWGYEAPCLVRFNGEYRLFVDGLAGTSLPGVGTHVTSSDSLTQAGRWAEPVRPMFLDEDNEQLIARHGTAIVLKAGTEEWQAAKKLLDEQKRGESSVMHRLYNPYSGEHLYTSNGLEPGNLTVRGWEYEGVGWIAPTTSSTPVYRLYNPYEKLGDHHYTTDAAEREAMTAAGWEDEGVGWYSDDSQGTPLYRQYNPNAYSMHMTGAHNYTADKDENDKLVKLGWKAEGIAWYGLGDEASSDDDALTAASVQL